MQKLIDHAALKVLMPFVVRYLKKGLDELQKSGKGATFNAPNLEVYAYEVFQHVTELDNAIAALNLTQSFVADVAKDQSSDPNIYCYHYENFILRAIGVVDRTHRLVGASFAMQKKKYASTRGNNFVQKEAKIQDSAVSLALRAVDEAVTDYRTLRNEFIHASAYSDRELGLLTVANELGVGTDDVDAGEAAQNYFLRGASEVEKVIAELAKTLTELLEALAPIFVLMINPDAADVNGVAQPDSGVQF